MYDLVCEKCGEKIDIKGDANWQFLISVFPRHLANCYISLASGPSVLPCDRCGHLTEFAVPQLVIGPDAASVLYLPDDRAPADAARDAKTLDIVARLRGSADVPGLTVARDRRTFRRAFLQRFVVPMADLANDFSLRLADNFSAHDGSPLEWVRQHEAKLGEAFFAAQWLLASGAAPLFLSTPDGGHASSFMPHEQAPPAADHVRKQREAQNAFASRTGEILGWLLACWAMRCFEDRSFERYRAAVANLISRVALSEPVRDAAANVVEHCAQQYKLGDPGAILGKYVFEAMLALLCEAHGAPNPRVAEWTQILLLYEYHRRLDGNDETWLLPPDIACRTLDEPVFWNGVRAIGGNIGDRLNDATAEKYDHLIETVARLYPSQARDFSSIEIIPDEHTSDEELIASFAQRMRAAVRQLPQATATRALLSGLRRRRPHLLEDAVAALAAALDETGASSGDRLTCWRYAIEALNRAGLYRVSRERAAEVERLLAAESDFPDGLRAQLLNEVGNCHRYAGQFATALRCYDAALRHWGREIEDRDTRIIMRNRAIVLRGMHRYAEARQVFAAIRPLAHDTELIDLVNSEALCLSQMGESARALALIEQHKALLERSVGEENARDCALFYAQLLSRHGRKAEAAALATSLAAAADHFHEPLAQAAAARLVLETIIEDLPEAERAAQRKRAIAILQSALDNAREIEGMPDILIGIAGELDDALLADGRADEAEAMLREAWSDAEAIGATTAWLLTLHAFRHATRRGDARQAGADLVRGVSLLGTALWTVAGRSAAVTCGRADQLRSISLGNNYSYLPLRKRRNRCRKRLYLDMEESRNEGVECW